MTDIPKGWKLVPEHATEAMEAAALAGVQGLHGIDDRDWRSKMPGDFFRLAWRHMFAAVEPFVLPTDPSPGSQVVGWTLVPNRPTNEMLEAMWEAMFEGNWDGSLAPMCAAGYEALLSLSATAAEGRDYE